MYCNKCGQELQNGQQFCPKCGEGIVQKDTLVCTQCKSPIDNNSKFCNVCGTPVNVVSTTKEFCSNCGTHLKDGERFCHNCGKSASGEESVGDNGVKKPLNGDVVSTNIWKRLCTPIGIKHAILAGVLLLLLIFICLPTFRFEQAYTFLSNTDLSYTAPVANPLFGSAEVSKMIDYADPEAQTAYNIMSFIVYFFDFAFLGLAIWVTVKPIIFNTLTKHRRLIYPRLIAIFWFITTLFWWLCFAAIGTSAGGMKVSITFSGILVLALCVIIIILSKIIAYNNRMLRENGYATA